MNFIDLRSFSKSDLEQIILDATEIKNGDKDVSKVFKGKFFGMLFGVASTRTRLSFGVGLKQMGAHGEYLNADDLQLKNHESLVDTAKVMDRYLDGLIVRLYDMSRYGEGRKALEVLAENTSFPVINALDDKDHPCQVMSDVLTMKEKLGQDFKKKKVVLTWGYAKRQKTPGVPHSMMIAGSILGMDLTIAHPVGFDLDSEYVEFAKEEMKKSGGTLTFSNDLMEASKDADVIYVKSWKALGLSGEEDMKRRNALKDDWRVSQRHFSVANPDAIFMNCLPIIRGEQADRDVIDGPKSVIYDEAENRLHMQKSIMNYIYENS